LENSKSSGQSPKPGPAKGRDAKRIDLSPKATKALEAIGAVWVTAGPRERGILRQRLTSLLGIKDTKKPTRKEGSSTDSKSQEKKEKQSWKAAWEATPEHKAWMAQKAILAKAKQEKSNELEAIGNKYQELQAAAFQARSNISGAPEPKKPKASEQKDSENPQAPTHVRTGKASQAKAVGSTTEKPKSDFQ
jgi:hypothetical protein